MELATKKPLLEGGNVFKDSQGTVLTRNIDRDDIPSTVHALEEIVGLSLEDNLLGSAGKKATSGDLDIAMDPEQISKEGLISRLGSHVEKMGWGEPKDFIRKSGISVHFRMPIANDPHQGYTQVDFMFTGGGPAETQWMKFGMYSAGDASQYSGADRNLLMSSIAKAQGLKYSWQKGLIRREDESPISKDPNQIAQKLFGKGYTGEVFDSVEQMQEAIHKNKKLKTALANLVVNLNDANNPDGSPRKPGEVRKNQEEAERIQRLVGY